MVAVSQAGEGTQPGIWTSTNAGVTWTNVTPAAGASNSWFNVVSDSTGQNLAVTGGADQSGVYDVWTSNNGGASWTNRTTGTNVGGQVWLGLASDSTGMKLVGGVGDYLYMSSKAEVRAGRNNPSVRMACSRPLESPRAPTAPILSPLDWWAWSTPRMAGTAGRPCPAPLSGATSR